MPAQEWIFVGYKFGVKGGQTKGRVFWILVGFESWLQLLYMKARFSCFVHYFSEMLGWQLGKWVLGGNSFACEHKAMCGKGLGRGILLEKLAGEEFCCAGLVAVWYQFARMKQ